MMWEAIEYSSPKVMGILNVTPDSFYDGGSYTSGNAISHHLEDMITQGADIIDIGAYSSRPGADDVSEQEEIRRLQKVLRIIQKEFPNILVSIDTFRLTVVKQIYNDFGTFMVNDISGGDFDSEMIEYTAKNNLPYVCMHMQGTPQTMQNNPQYNDVVSDILLFFQNKIKESQKYNHKHFVIDPGFGFGKTVEQNYQLLNKLEAFTQLGKPILVGVSRKSMIQKVLGCNASEALNGTSIVNTIALMKGANILRVHDVKEAKEAIAIVSQL